MQLVWPKISIYSSTHLNIRLILGLACYGSLILLTGPSDAPLDHLFTTESQLADLKAAIEEAMQMSLNQWEIQNCHIWGAENSTNGKLWSKECETSPYQLKDQSWTGLSLITLGVQLSHNDHPTHPPLTRNWVSSGRRCSPTRTGRAVERVLVDFCSVGK